MSGYKSKYVTLMEKNGNITYMTGKHTNVEGKRKLLIPPKLKSTSKHYNTEYKCMGSWYNTEEFKQWLFNEAKQWADEINGKLVMKNEKRPDDRVQVSAPIPEVK